MKKQPFRRRLGFAVSGIAEAWRREPSFRAQVVIAVAALAATAVLRPGLLWTVAVVVAIAMVTAFELINTAIETVIDHLHPEQAPEIKRAKDIAAGAVLAASAGAAVVGALMVASVAFR